MNELNAQIEYSGNPEYPFAVVYDSNVPGEATKVLVFAQFSDSNIATEVAQIANQKQHFTQRCYELAIGFANHPHNPKGWYKAAHREMPPRVETRW